MKITVTSFILFTFAIGSLWAQNKISGLIKDEQGEAIVGATILEKNSRNFTISDESGSFTLSLSQNLPVILQINSLGFKQQEIDLREIPTESLSISLKSDLILSEIIVSARRRSETAQEIPIPISVVSGDFIQQSGAFNINRLKELVPTVQLYSSNPRNTGINIRGLGSPFGLTNDGLDPGVGFYVDGVYYARPAVATLDFVDIERIEILRGPQGTLFGKNTTSGAFNITTRQPGFTPSADFEISYGNYRYIQAKGSVTGPLIKNKLAARISFSGTQRDGTVYNIAKDEHVNELNNLGLSGKLLFTPNKNISLTLAGDASSQNPNGYAQVLAGVVQTQRAAYRQFNNIIADLNYTLPSLNAFDRRIDHDTPWRSLNELGGVSLNADIKIGTGTLTSTTAWRYWNWGPSNDRDFTGLQALAKSQNPSKHRNWSQEIRYAGELSPRLSGVVGVFFIGQEVETNGLEESGSAQWRFSQSSTSNLWQTPGLFEGYGASTQSSIESLSAAVFANIDWEIVKGLHILPGIRYNYDKKDVSYNRSTFGGLQTEDPALIALQRTVYTAQSFEADANETNLTYQLTLSYNANDRLNAYATYSTSYKPVGVNVAGLPVIGGEVAVELGTIKPEYVRHIELGLKSTLTDNLTLNATFFNTDVDDYQTNVQSPELGVNRGYIANADQVNVRGLELDAHFKAKKYLSLQASLAYTDGKYVRFTNAPLPLEETGRTVEGTQVAFKDISGSELPGISKWAGSLSGEFSVPIQFIGLKGDLFLALDAFYRSSFSSSPSPSQYLNVDGYTLVNARLGFRASQGLSIFVWSRNLLNKDYYEQLLVAGGNAGHYAGVLGDPRTYGITIRQSFDFGRKR
ncbi:MAG: TonB-dependent receptor [Microscillaceae bacterium]|nr:TonB-dependent receptor [Microscillaceae bacterium]